MKKKRRAKMEKSKIAVRVCKGRHYFYKGHEYAVLSLTMIKVKQTGLDDWVHGIVYKRVDGDAPENLPEVITFSRELQDFITKFNPIELMVGDNVEVISMSKTRGFLTVESIDNSVEFGVKFKGYEHAAKKYIDPITLQIEVENPEQATEYFYARPSHAVSIPIEGMKKVLDDWQRILNSNSACNADAQLQIIDKLKKIQGIISQ